MTEDEAIAQQEMAAELGQLNEVGLLKEVAAELRLSRYASKLETLNTPLRKEVERILRLPSETARNKQLEALAAELPRDLPGVIKSNFVTGVNAAYEQWKKDTVAPSTPLEGEDKAEYNKFKKQLTELTENDYQKRYEPEMIAAKREDAGRRKPAPISESRVQEKIDALIDKELSSNRFSAALVSKERELQQAAHDRKRKANHPLGR